MARIGFFPSLKMENLTNPYLLRFVQSYPKARKEKHAVLPANLDGAGSSRWPQNLFYQHIQAFGNNPVICLQHALTLHQTALIEF